MAQSVMAAVSQRRGLDGVEDFGGSADSAWGDRYGLGYIAQGIIVPTGLRCCKEKETIWKRPILAIVVAGERAQAVRGLGGIDEPTIGTDLEDETVGSSLCIRGRGCGTNTCTE
ncbi:hypothetical protein RISW2_18930 [Roseivivax isoporae LMG 25204]|uniref:Uncharacterized protein n=1 Tax=Roseivivax isoporae LMG 25204 TaxID=1449351 RepID=X7F401_9RHOB|nr:hypothetical protein RISW2_18930 [Roseivivax isoporae LMG 25204]